MALEDSIAAAASLVKSCSNVYALTGAGVSVESGIPDFRSSSGLWSRFDPMEYGTLGAFRSSPSKVWSMLAELVKLCHALPNAGHFAMARMEEEGLLKGVITQNIDGLHQKAGSRNVVEFHGSIFRLRCLSCSRRFSLHAFMESLPPTCPVCGEILKPDIVFFDEAIPEEASRAVEQIIGRADLLIVAGTSCSVMPAAMIPHEVLKRGGRIIEVNPEPAMTEAATVVVRGTFAHVMQEILDRL